MLEENDDLTWLAEFFHFLCDGEWEHDDGITLRTLDNPGWMLLVALSGTSLADKNLKEIDIRRSETDWIVLRKNQHIVEGFCGALNLTELVSIFRRWVMEAERA